MGSNKDQTRADTKRDRTRACYRSDRICFWARWAEYEKIYGGRAGGRAVRAVDPGSGAGKCVVSCSEKAVSIDCGIGRRSEETEACGVVATARAFVGSRLTSFAVGG